MSYNNQTVYIRQFSTIDASIDEKIYWTSSENPNAWIPTNYELHIKPISDPTERETIITYTSDSRCPDFATVKANTLKNGNSYNCYVILSRQGTYKRERVETVFSCRSQTEFFKCLSTPIFRVKTQSPGMIITKSPSVNIPIEYAQAEGEELEWYQIDIKNKNTGFVKTTSKVFDMSHLLENEFTGLEAYNNENSGKVEYEVIAFGKTVNDIEVKSEPVTVRAEYIPFQISQHIKLENKPYGGYVEIIPDYRPIIGESEHEIKSEDFKVNSKYKTSYLDISNNKITYDRGFSAEGDFSVQMFARLPVLNKDIITLRNKDERIHIGVYRKEKRNDTMTYSVDSNGKYTFFDDTWNLTAKITRAEAMYSDYIRLAVTSYDNEDSFINVRYVFDKEIKNFDTSKFYKFLIYRQGQTYDLIMEEVI